jgi:hypothetical protein
MITLGGSLSQETAMQGQAPQNHRGPQTSQECDSKFIPWYLGTYLCLYVDSILFSSLALHHITIPFIHNPSFFPLSNPVIRC